MKWWFIGTGSALGLGLAAMLVISIYVSIGTSVGEQWSSLDGPEPVWPATIGFAGMNLVVLSGVALVILVVIAAVRAVIGQRRD